MLGYLFLSPCSDLSLSRTLPEQVINTYMELIHQKFRLFIYDKSLNTMIGIKTTPMNSLGSRVGQLMMMVGLLSRAIPTNRLGYFVNEFLAVCKVDVDLARALI